MTEENQDNQQEFLNLKVEKPPYDIWQKVFIAQKNKPKEVEIINHRIITYKNKGKIECAIFGFDINNWVFVREGEKRSVTSKLEYWDINLIFADCEEAKKYSRFLGVKVDDENWKLAIGDRDIEDESSPYHINNCNLPSCCGNISEARSILIYCKENKGLIIPERNHLEGLVGGHGFPEKDVPLYQIYEQLEITEESIKRGD